MELKRNEPLYQLQDIASILRGEKGCAWDKAQTSNTLKPYLIEETYEVIDAIENGDIDNLKEELGDLLYQVYAHAQLASEEKNFNIDDVAKGIINKLIRRHPHVFGNERIDNKKDVIKKWENIKREEKKPEESILNGIPKHLPALLKAYRVQQKVSRIGFDWDRIEDVNIKLEEEIREFREALSQNDPELIYEEIGDIFFTLVNISRFIGINPEEALKKTIQKFIKRFQYIEKETLQSGKKMDEMSLNELDEIWERAKEP
ncbi:MAG: nucleoside triphosphate pyrophosphohydrolase [Spirochaetota bacterium]|nr:nucleoside triphosphate pyrophosphohydrolase [Spirochaetota bacterium]